MFFNKAKLKKGRVITVVIPCHNQDDIVRLNIELLNKQVIKPDFILVVDDHSKKFDIQETSQVKVHKLEERGRVCNRNAGILEALKLGSDIIIFMDGDSIPCGKDFIFNYLRYNLTKPTILFGMRTHINRPVRLKEFNFEFDYEYERIKKFPSDMLTANLDKKWNFDNTDLRIVSGVTEVYNDIKDFDEKANMICSGLVTWSCNFLITKDAAIILGEFMKRTHGVNGWFDYKTFGTDWGGEDNAFGLDSHFAGIQTYLTTKSKIYHFMHERTDQLFTHVKLNNILLNRLINLHNLKKKNI